jgi:hypothetical protein
VLPNAPVKRIIDKARGILQSRDMPVSPGLDSRSVREVVDAVRSSLGVEAWEQAKKVSSSHVNAEVLRAVIKCCSDEACCVLERDKPLCPRAAHAASFCTAAAAEHGDDAVALDALAQRLRSVGLSSDAAVLADMSAKLQKDGTRCLSSSDEKV